MRTSALALLCCLLAASDARAFVCARVSIGSSPGSSLAWSTREIPFSLYARGTNDLDGSIEFEVLRSSFEAWRTLNVPEGIEACGLSAGTDITFRETALSTTDRIGYDFLHPELSENLLIFRDSDWDAAEDNVIALTTTTYDSVTGEILDADIEFNSAVFNFSTTTSGMNLANTAVHEIGHFLGLAHTQSANTDATMYARAVPGETKKADLACDDALAVVFKYPAGEANGYCSPAVDACGFCAPPREPSPGPTVRVTAKAADGALEGGCASGAPFLWVIIALAFRRRFRCSRSSAP